jgi:hypothetical protein
MANEITLSLSLSCFKPSIMSTAIGRAITTLLRSMTGATYIQDTMSVTTSALAVPLGSVSAPHWGFFLNLDPTNYITLMNGAAGAVFARLLAGDPCLVPLDPTCVPWAQANTLACQMEYLIMTL